MTELSSLASDNLDKQGFCSLGEEGKARYARSLRFTPAVATVLIVMGLILRSPIVMGSVALIALTGVLFPRGMLIDVVYNLGIRHIFRSPQLPPTPTPRRFSYGISALWLAGSAASFHFGLPLLGIALGAVVAIGSTVLATTLWCLGSWLYRPVGASVAALKRKSDAGK